MMRTAMLIAALGLTACASAPPIKVDDVAKVETENVPVATSCIAKDFSTAPPAFPDTREARLATTSPDQDYSLLAQGSPMHWAWEKSLWDQVQACRPPPDPG